MEVSSACRKTGEPYVFAERIISQKACGMVRGAYRKGQVYLTHSKQCAFNLIVGYKITG